MKKDLLPIGSVVILNDGTKKVMITGYASKSADDDRVYDYSGCIFPEGIMENVYCLFDTSDIKELFFEGYKCDEFEEYTGKMDSVLSASESNLFSNVKGGSDDSKKGHRIIKPPKHPKSKEDMHRLYDVNKISGGQTKIYDPSEYED